MKRRVVKKVLSTVLVSTMLLSLIGCAGGSEESSSGSDDGNITIRVASRYSTDIPDDVFYREKVQEFNEMDNGIIVESDDIVTESDYLDKLRTSFANGDTPNAFIEFGGSRVLDYVETDVLVDMQPYFDEDSAWYDSFYESMFDQLRYPDYEGQVWGVPFKSYVVSLYYNKEIFEEQNLEVPTTWDELLEVSEKLTEAGIRPFQMGAKDAWRGGHFHNNLVIKSLGAEAVDKLADRTLAYDSPEMIATYQKFLDLNEKGYLGNDILNTDYAIEKETYAAGGCAMRWDGSWYVSEIHGTDIYDKTGVAAFPAIDEKFASEAQGGGSDMWYVSKLGKSDEEIEATIEFLKFITSQEYFALNNEVASAVYPVKFEATANTPENPLLDEVNALLASYTTLRADIQNYDSESHMLDTVRNAIQGLAMGNSAEQCGREIVERMEDGN